MSTWPVAPARRCTLRSFVLLTFVGAIAMAAFTGCASAAPGRVFYVSPTGRDSNSGLSPGSAWRTVTRVNDATLRPGDHVLFRGNATYVDATLMPGQGFGASGAKGAPIVFGGYGAGRPRLAEGIWIGGGRGAPNGPSYLTFSHFALGPVKGFQGTGSAISLLGLDISSLMPPTARQEIGIQTEGDYWTIAGNRIDRVGGSGMLLGANADDPGQPAGGEYYSVHDNVISHTGLDDGIDYPTHGIYLKVARAHVFHNTISDFRDEGVSARYRDADITHNAISGGQIGIGWYQYDSLAGESRFTDNRIADMTAAGIFVCGAAEGCLKPIESFRIAGNRLSAIQGRRMNLQPTTGTYALGRRS